MYHIAIYTHHICSTREVHQQHLHVSHTHHIEQWYVNSIRYGISGTLFPVPYGIILLMQEKIMGMVTKTGISWLPI